MPNLPSRGRCHAIFLLAYTARVRHCDDIGLWIEATLDKPTHMAGALDLEGAANLLIDLGLARLDTRVVITGSLQRLDRIADMTTLKAIARLILERQPPDWLRSVVVNGRFVSEYMPNDDLKAILWLGEDLEGIIVAAYAKLFGEHDDALLKLLGDAGELAVMSALRSKGLNPRHVALVSDRFGYDIEWNVGSQRYALEVKTAVTATAARVLVSRNEFEVAKNMGDRWKLVQVTFSSRVIAQGRAAVTDVERIRELTSATLGVMAPADSDVFRWEESAEFRPPLKEWRASDLVVGHDFQASLS